MKSLHAEQVDGPVPELIAATEEALPRQANALARTRAFAEPLIAQAQAVRSELRLRLRR